MLLDVVLVLCLPIAAAAGFYLGRRTTREEPAEKPVTYGWLGLPVETSHEHDWHIGGKDSGQVRYECVCGEVRHG